jgi:hypothetical protein
MTGRIFDRFRSVLGSIVFDVLGCRSFLFFVFSCGGLVPRILGVIVAVQAPSSKVVSWLYRGAHFGSNPHKGVFSRRCFSPYGVRLRLSIWLKPP